VRAPYALRVGCTRAREQGTPMNTVAIDWYTDDGDWVNEANAGSREEAMHVATHEFLKAMSDHPHSPHTVRIEDDSTTWYITNQPNDLFGLPGMPS